ncbi:prepilin-type N-terminal cleavage/methylation domain-containing protein [Lentisphaera profundi]|uniref:Prepilin-type N-terminal cleavage/methylation domain-containing protein n=1 Tax=Lentisphaera profundi TaxID=1658616 RepID=A0ABY7VZ80_9BACT|nr:prepilin-type N-terminal cleavage/methylation domain-containing protein [Lentisphaera profundi]WDE99241.1 prepilin-type N-terminal cleavage/methylation domain-containing protein [Lentisphaera profundi]
MKRFTLIELLVVIAIIGILASLLLPVLAKSKKQALATTCTSRLKQNFIMIQLMVDDHEGYFNNRRISQHYPDSAKVWSERVLSDYWPNGSKKNVVCPLQEEAAMRRSTDNRVAYGAPNTTQLSDAANPEEIHLLNGNSKTGVSGVWKNGREITERWLLVDSYFAPWKAPTPTISNLNDNKIHLLHLNKANIVFVDGHVEAYNSMQVLYGLGFNKVLTESLEIIEK